MDKIDVELLWVLQQSPSQPIGISEIKKKNNIFSKSDHDISNKLHLWKNVDL